MVRNLTLDYFKLILSFLVVSIHISLYEDFSEGSLSYTFGWLCSNGLARIAVPCFFIINGYFLPLSNLNKFKKYIRHLLTIWAVWMICYFPTYYKELLHSNLMLSIVTFVFGFFHLWYLNALIYGAICLFFLIKSRIPKIYLLLLAILLYGLGYMIQSRSPEDFPDLFRRFFIFGIPFLSIGIPFLILGYLLKQVEIISRIKKYLPLILVGGFFLLFMESYSQMIYSGGTIFFISLIFLCPALFLFTLNRNKLTTSSSFISDVSNGVYFSHILVMFFVNKFLNQPQLVIYMVTLISSVLIGIVLSVINKKIKIFL